LQPMARLARPALVMARFGRRCGPVYVKFT
jgi:hypothetical protein